jgi:hypothetical protein
MQIKPELNKAYEHFHNFILLAIKNKDHLEIYLNASHLSDDEKTFCWEYWDIYHNGGCEEIVEEEVEVDFDDMTKREIETLAREEFDVELDRRHSKATLVAQYESLKNN